MRQRTRFVQRNLRMALILVDGKSAVAELCAKTGNPQMTENALRELEQGGFIAPLPADALWLLQQNRKTAQENKAAALETFSRFSAFDEKRESVPETRSLPPALPAATSAYVPGDLLEGEGISLEFSGGMDEHLKKADSRAVPGERNGFGVRFEGLFGRHAPLDDDCRIAPLRRGPRPRSFAWLLSLLFGALLLVVVAMFLPYGRYLPALESSLTRMLGLPVQIQSMHVGFYPRPGLSLENVRVGDVAHPLRVAKMRLQPELGSLFAARVVFSEVAASGVELPAETLAALPAVFAAFAQPSSTLAIEHVSLEHTEVSLHGLVLAGLAGEIRLDRNAAFQALSLHTPERTFQLEARAAAQGFEFEMTGQNWHPSATAPYVLDSLSLAGKLDGSALQISSLDARLLGGALSGEIRLAAETSLSLSGQLVYERIDLKRLGHALGVDWQLEGGVSGKLAFSAQAEDWADLSAALDGGGELGVRQGVLGGVDLKEAVRRAAAVPVRGGATRFERLSGRLRFVQGAYRLSDVALNAGLLRASGGFMLSTEGQLSGALDVHLGGPASHLRMPVSIGGTLKVPEVTARHP